MAEIIQFVPASKPSEPDKPDTAPSELPFHPAGTADQHGVPYAAEDDGDCA